METVLCVKERNPEKLVPSCAILQIPSALVNVFLRILSRAGHVRVADINIQVGGKLHQVTTGETNWRVEFENDVDTPLHSEGHR